MTFQHCFVVLLDSDLIPTWRLFGSINQPKSELSLFHGLVFVPALASSVTLCLHCYRSVTALANYCCYCLLMSCRRSGRCCVKTLDFTVAKLLLLKLLLPSLDIYILVARCLETAVVCITAAYSMCGLKSLSSVPLLSSSLSIHFSGLWRWFRPSAKCVWWQLAPRSTDMTNTEAIMRPIHSGVCWRCGVGLVWGRSPSTNVHPRHKGHTQTLPACQWHVGKTCTCQCNLNTSSFRH